MNSYRLLVSLAALGMCTVVEAAPEYEATVQQAYTAQRSLKRIGIAPIACPRAIECDEFEKAIIERLEERTGMRVVPSKEVVDLMTTAGVTSLEERESRLIIAEGLGVDAFAYVRVPKAEVDVTEPPEDDKWRQVKRQVETKSATLELQVVARDGASLARATGDAHVSDSVRGLTTITIRLFERVVERVWR